MESSSESVTMNYVYLLWPLKNQWIQQLHGEVTYSVLPFLRGTSVEILIFCGNTDLGVGWKRGKAGTAAMRERDEKAENVLRERHGINPPLFTFLLLPSTDKSLRMRNYDKSAPEVALSTLILDWTWHRKIAQRTKMEERWEEKQRAYFQTTHLFRIFKPSLLIYYSFSQNFQAQAQLREQSGCFCNALFPIPQLQLTRPGVDLNPRSWSTPKTMTYA